MHNYTLVYGDSFLRDLTKIDKKEAQKILSWLNTHIQGTDNPKHIGKQLKGKEFKKYWRYRVDNYRVDNYRVIVLINKKDIKVTCIKVGHRKDIYNKLKRLS